MTELPNNVAQPRAIDELAGIIYAAWAASSPHRDQSRPAMLLLIGMTPQFCGFPPPSPSLQTKSIEQARTEMLQEGAFDYFLMTFDSHVRLGAFLSILPQLADRLYWRLLRDVWISSEVTLPQRQSWLELLHSQRPERENLMICSERRLLNRLPDVVTIYRGCGHLDGIPGLSWTLSYDRAKFFAAYSCGPRRKFLCPDQQGLWPIVAKARCSKRDVIAYIAQRKEEEVIVDPSKISVIEATEWRRPHREGRSA